MKKKLLTILLVSVMTMSLVACGDDSPNEETDEVTTQETDSADDYATKENPANVAENNTVDGLWGQFSFQLKHAYTGNDATDFLESIGEDIENFPFEEGNKLVVLEYTVKADKGFDENPFEGSEVVGNDLWDTELESKYEYLVFDLYENANLDYYNLTLETGEESTMYEVLELPEDVNSFVTSIDGDERDYWFLYDLTK